MSRGYRAFAERKPDGTWYMHCIDLCLDAVGDSYEEGRRKLQDSIELYLEWADEHGMSESERRRPSPLEFRLRYLRHVAVERIRHLFGRSASGSGHRHSVFTATPSLAA